MIRMHFDRLFRTKRFYVAVLCVCGLSILSLLGEIQAFSKASVYYFILSRHGIGAFFIAMSVISVFPYALNYSIDVESRYEYGIFSRCKRRNYCWANILVTACSAFLTVLLGYLLLYLLLRLRYPLLLPEEEEQLLLYAQQDGLTPYEQLLTGRMPFLYFLSVFTTEAMGYAFLACVTLTVSAKVKNAFILLSVPLMVYFGCQYLTNILRLPWIFRWDNIMSHGGYFALLSNNPGIVLTEVILYFSALIVICGFIFTKLVKGSKGHD